MKLAKSMGSISESLIKINFFSSVISRVLVLFGNAELMSLVKVALRPELYVS